MGTHEKTDLRVIRNRQAIIDSFKSMVMEMPASKITISELANRASIHRKTFYLHFQCIEDLYEYCLHEVLDEYFKVLDAIPKEITYRDVNETFFRFMSNADPFIERILTHPSYKVIAHYFFSAIGDHCKKRNPRFSERSKPEQNIINAYMTIMDALYIQWVKDNKAIPTEDMIQLCEQLIYYGISSVKNNKHLSPEEER